MPDRVTDLLRPAPTPRALVGEDGVLTGLGVAPATERDAALLAALRVSGVTHDSGQVRAGDLYAALPGARTHGARFVAQAVQRGAAAVLTDPVGQELVADSGLPTAVHPSPRSVLGEVAARVYGRPAEDLLLVGVTGTNGKTTLTYLLDAALHRAGHRTGVIGTVGTRIADQAVATARTTPEATDVHALLAVMREQGVTAVAMEVSSHALVLGRVDGLCFDVAVFTNLSRDHLDFHRDLEDYFAAKARLFEPARSRRAVVCVDDAWGRRLQQSIGAPLQTYGVEAPADWSAEAVTDRPGGSTVQVRGPHATVMTLQVGLPGRFNVANAIGALAAAVAAGIELPVAASGISACTGVPGRMERVQDPDPERALVAFVDYAHTPEAVSRAITAVRTGSNGRVLVVLGAGGDRDTEKRPEMGRAAAALADQVVVTDDNPRSEDPGAIRATLLAGARSVRSTGVQEVADRAGAIAAAVAAAAPGDVVLVLGKGHEQGQEVAGRVHPFDDRASLAAALAGRAS